MTSDEANAVVTEAFNNYSARILCYCEQKLKDVSNNADDCVQEAYNALFKKLLSGETVENIGGFCTRPQEIMY